MEGSSWQSTEGRWDDNEPELSICTYIDPSGRVCNALSWLQSHTLQ